MMTNDQMLWMLAGAALPFLLLLIALSKLWNRNRKLTSIQERSDSLERNSECVERFSDLADNLVGENSAEGGAEETVRTALLNEFVKVAQRSVECASAAYFAYDRNENLVRMVAMEGLFPSCLAIDDATLKYVAGKNERVEEYLRNHSFKLNDTPFAAAVEQNIPKHFDREDCLERVRYRVYDLFSLLLVPVKQQKKVCGILALSNKKGGGDFSKADRDLAQNLCNVVGSELNQLGMTLKIKEKVAIDSQMEAAVSIQNHLLPKDSCEMGRVLARASYKTAYRLGGDYYDFVLVDENHLGVLVADVSGKGISAGLVMASTRALMDVLAKNVLSPAKLLTELNGHLFRLIPETMFVTASYAIFDITTGKMVCAHAGHEPVLAAFGSDDVKSFRGKGMVLGILDNEIFAPEIEDKTYDLAPGDTVLFYTDGAVEAINTKREEFSRERLMGALENVRRQTPEEILRFLNARIAQFTEGREAYDDITLVVVQIART